MSSRPDPDLAPTPEITLEPLNDCTVYLVDISDAIGDYLKVPHQIRMVGCSEGAPYNATDMLDIELSAIIPCLNEKDRVAEEMAEHLDNLLEEGQEQLRFLMEQDGVELKDIETRSIPNTADQLAHAKAIHELGERVHEVLLENHLYDETGCLMGEHCSVMTGGILVLRAD